MPSSKSKCVFLLPLLMALFFSGTARSDEYNCPLGTCGESNLCHYQWCTEGGTSTKYFCTSEAGIWAWRTSPACGNTGNYCCNAGGTNSCLQFSVCTSSNRQYCQYRPAGASECFDAWCTNATTGNWDWQFGWRDALFGQCSQAQACQARFCGSDKYYCTKDNADWQWRNSSFACFGGDYCCPEGCTQANDANCPVTAFDSPTPSPTPTSTPTPSPMPSPNQSPTPAPTTTQTPVPTPTPSPSPTAFPANSPPMLFIFSPANASFANATPIFSISATDDNSPRLNCTIMAWQEGNLYPTIRSIYNSSVYNATKWTDKLGEFTEGKWEWNATCVDAGGATNAWLVPGKFFVDSTPPRIFAEWPVNVTNGTAAAFYANVSDNGALEACGLHVNGAFKANLSLENKTSYLRASRNYTFSQTGIYNVSIACVDKAKNIGANSSQINVSIQFQETVAGSPTPTPSPNASVTPPPTPTPAPNASITPVPTPAENAMATPEANAAATPTATPEVSPTPTPMPAVYPSHYELIIDGQNAVSADFGNHSSSFNLSYAPGAGGFEGTISYRLPFDYALFEEGKISFSPVPSTVTQGSIIAYWQASLAPQQAFTATLNVAEVFNQSILQQFTAAMLEAATPVPSAIVSQTPSSTPRGPANLTPSPTPDYSCLSVAFNKTEERDCLLQGGFYEPVASFGCVVGYKCLKAGASGAFPISYAAASNEKSREILNEKKNISITLEKGLVEQLGGNAERFLIALVPNATYLIYPSQVDPWGKNEVSGVFASTNPLKNVSCTAAPSQGNCSCELKNNMAPENFADQSLRYRSFFCTMDAGEMGKVNGSYRLLAFDNEGRSNDLRDKILLVPGAASVFTEREVVVGANDPFFTALLVLVLLSIVTGTAYLVREKMESEKNKRLALFNKKAQIENDFKMLKYRYLKRELDDVAFKKIWDAKEKEYSDVKARLLEQQEKEKKGKTQQ